MPGQAAGDNPGFIAPMLATAAVGLPPDADEFVAEVKRDGPRACIAAAGGRVRAWSRSGRDITAVNPELGALATVARCRALVLDGEIVALSGPRPDFTVLQRRMRASRPGAALLAAVAVTLIIFDVLHSGSEDLTGSPYVLRRALLEDLGGERDQPVPSSGAAAREITGGHQNRERRPGASALAGSPRPGCQPAGRAERQYVYFLLGCQPFPGSAVPYLLKKLRQLHAAGQRQLVGVYAVSVGEFLAQVGTTADICPMGERAGI